MKKRHFNWKAVIVLVISLVVLVVTVFGLRQWQRNRLAYTARQAGLKAYENRLWENAVTNLGRYLAVNHGDTQILLKYAEAQLNIRPLKRNNIQQAVATYRTILRIDKNNLTAVEKLVSLYLQMNIPAEAELIALRYLQTDKNPKISTMLAMALAKQRKFAEAASQLQTVIQKHPEQILAYEVLGQLTEHRPEDFVAGAEYWFNEAVKNNPSSAHAFIARAGFYSRGRDVAAAVADLEKAEKLNLSDQRIHLRLASEFAKVNMFEKARAHLVEILAQEPASLALWQAWATVSLETASREEMCYVAKTGLKELAPDVWDFMPTAAELFIRSGQFACAGDCLVKLKQKDIDPAAVAFLEGFRAETEKQDYKAIMFWHQAQQLGDKSEKTHLALAKAYWRAGDNQSAILQLRTLVSEQPSLFSGHYHLARLLAQTGSLAEAAEHARLARQINPDDIDAALLDIQARMQLTRSSQTNGRKQIWQNIERQLDELENSTGGAPRVKLLRFQLAMDRGLFSLAEQLLTDLKANENRTIEVAIAGVDLFIAQDKVGPAISELYKITEESAQDVLPIRYLAALLAKHGNRANCEKVLKDAMQNIKAPEARRDLGILLAGFYDRWGQNDKTRQLLTALSQELPYDILIKRQLLKSDSVKKDNHQAQQLVDNIRIIEGEDGWQWRYEQANIRFAGENFKNHYPQIIALLKRNLSVNPDDQTSRMLLGAVYDNAGELQLAVATYREALDRDPQDIRIIVRTVALMHKAEEYKQAEEILNQAVQQNLFHRQISKLKTQNYLRQGRFDSAETILEDLMVEDPNSRAVSLSLALLKIRNNKYDQARKLLNKLKTEQPQAQLVNAALVELNVRQNKNEEALAICDEMIKQRGGASAHILRGKTYLMLGQNNRAKEDFERAVSMEPDNVQAWISKSDFNFSIGRLEEAIKDTQKALVLEPENVQIQKRTIAFLLSSGEPDKMRHGRKLIDKALSSSPQDIDLRLYKARSLMAEKTAPAIEQAQRILRKITEERPKTADAWALWTQIYLEQAQQGKAIDTLLRGLTYSPNDKNLLLLKARTEAGRAPVLAIPTLKLLNDREPDNVETALELAKTYVAAGQCDKSITLLQNLLTRCKEKERRRINTALAVALYKNGNKAEAKQKFDLFYEDEANDSKVFLAEADLLIDSQKWGILYHRVNDWLQHNPDDTDTSITIARNLTRTKNDDALNTAERLLRRILDQHPHCLQAMNLLAMLLQVTGRPAESAKIYKQILDIEPDALVALNNLAWIMCEQQNKYQQALELAQRGLRKAPDYVDLIDTRGVVYYKLGEHHSAVRDFTRCVELYPKNSSSLAASHFHLARALVALGQDNRAIDNLQKTLDLNDKVGGLSPTEITEAKRLLGELLSKDNYGPVIN